MPLKTLQGIQQALGRSGGSQWVYVVVGIALLAILAGLVHVLSVQVRRRNRLRAAWQRLVDRMSELKVTPQERALVIDLARREALWSPVDVLEKMEVFERAVHRHMEESRAAGGAGQAGARVRSLRVKLDFTRRPGTGYHSTRELAPGQELDLAVPQSRGYPPLHATVRGGREDLLELAQLQPADAGLAGRRVEATFYSGKRAFRFESEVTQVDVPRSACLLLHTLDVTPAGVREFHRVAVGKPVTFRAAWEKPEVQREGTLEDLSGGGLAVLCPCYYETGEELVFQVRPALWWPPGEGQADKPPEDREVTGSIVDTQLTGDGRCVHHVEFRDIAETDRRYLLGLVRLIEVTAAGQGTG